MREGDKVTIAMPNCPQAIQMFYAVNLIGGICNMIHPLSAEKEIEFYLNESESVTAITLDQFYNKFENIRQNTKVVNIVIASIKDELSKPVKAGYMLTEGRKIKKIPEDAPVIRWKEFLHMGKHCFYNYKVKRTGKDPAVILYSGGTTGTTKGILLSNRNFNALGQQVIAANPMFRVGDKMRLKGPEGTSTFQTPKGRKAVFLATGTGIASVKSIVSTLVENNDLEGRELFIYWGVRTSQELVVGEIFEEWAAAHQQIHYTGVVSREDTWPGAKGHVQTFAAADNGDMTDMDAYLCGSNSMIKAAVNYLTARCGLREDHIFMDNFGF